MVKRKSDNRNIEIEIRIPAPRENLGAFSVRIGFFPKEIRVYIDRFIQKSPERAKKSGHGDGQRKNALRTPVRNGHKNFASLPF